MTDKKTKSRKNESPKRLVDKPFTIQLNIELDHLRHAAFPPIIEPRVVDSNAIANIRDIIHTRPKNDPERIVEPEFYSQILDGLDSLYADGFKVARVTARELLDDYKDDADLGKQLDDIAKRFGLSRDQFLRVAGGDDPDQDLALAIKEEPKKSINLIFDPDFYDQMQQAAGDRRLTEWVTDIVERHVERDDYLDIEVPKPKRNMNPPDHKETLSPSMRVSLIERLDEIATANNVRRANVIQSLVQREMGMSHVPGVHDAPEA